MQYCDSCKKESNSIADESVFCCEIILLLYMLLPKHLSVTNCTSSDCRQDSLNNLLRLVVKFSALRLFVFLITISPELYACFLLKQELCPWVFIELSKSIRKFKFWMDFRRIYRSNLQFMPH